MQLGKLWGQMVFWWLWLIIVHLDPARVTGFFTSDPLAAVQCEVDFAIDGDESLFNVSGTLAGLEATSSLDLELSDVLVGALGALTVSYSKSGQCAETAEDVIAALTAEESDVAFRSDLRPLRVYPSVIALRSNDLAQFGGPEFMRLSEIHVEVDSTPLRIEERTTQSNASASLAGHATIRIAEGDAWVGSGFDPPAARTELAPLSAAPETAAEAVFSAQVGQNDTGP